MCLAGVSLSLTSLAALRRSNSAWCLLALRRAGAGAGLAGALLASVVVVVSDNDEEEVKEAMELTFDCCWSFSSVTFSGGPNTVDLRHRWQQQGFIKHHACMPMPYERVGAMHVHGEQQEERGADHHRRRA